MTPMRAHVLVVDDVADMADSTVELLALWGFGAVACYGGEEALACARDRPPATVLLDVLMPRMDGLQFARAFRALKGCGGVPVVALSGSAPPAGARAAGIDHFLLKPVLPNRLRALLVALTRRAARPRLPARERRPDPWTELASA
ncbi:DNA-binding response regulator MtrA [Gemmata obscuriglobus]|uniref:Response regulator n=1 Tax=Gemmata obscuriglobus TaxID=114 RepID=A0A2Z3GWT5_9BACT|nr:response regulator [Gemmata obscuriglobus]AWM37798.1 response regulator [Gemmata obscuriglobus]QEG29383.1 DNA-binding response regulator MtrA [Gemmata obscuriglobus]VTS08439.1 transcriptional regulator : Two component response regulator protein OS=Herbaspirillum frisingense GSF30 GN=HFRIS_004538 PE=4 SV=1: Response_reg [Gemmata obscuriglobus UQM 2246]